MQAIFVEIPCPLCLGDDFSVLYQPDQEKLKSFTFSPEVLKCTTSYHDFFMRLVRCNRCGMVMTNPQPEEKFMLELAAILEDDLYEKERPAKIRTFEKALEEVNRICPPSPETRYLDFSCYSGLFVETLHRHNRNAVGVDICAKMVQSGNRRIKEEKLYAGPLEQWDQVFCGRKFDVITSWDAIEHVSSPIPYLKKANQLLENRGYLVVATMNYSSLFARLCGRRWLWLMPMHLYYFTPETLAKALSKSGFKVVHRTTYTHYVSLGYLFYKMSPSIGGMWQDSKFLKNFLIPVNLGDFMIIFAEKVS